jgi:ABC-type Fe3+-hydroxamate transport system substrate-binding protein
MPLFTDQTGRKISLDKTPKRIISLVPSQTELLFDLDLTEEVVGITKFCIHPKEWFQIKTKVGGTKELKLYVIHQLNPDLIIQYSGKNSSSKPAEVQALVINMFYFSATQINC